jgi:SAM-dependent MidA family methyltransferase
VAWQDALYGAGGFYRSAEGPAGHFGTSATMPAGVREVFAGAVLRLAAEQGCTTVVDVGAGRGELLAALDRARSTRLELLGVDVVPRPAGLPEAVGWLESPGGADLPSGLTGLAEALVLANEWLDVVPLDVLEVDRRGVPRVVEVDRSGRERLGPAADEEQLGWCRGWWPIEGSPAGTRAEVGLTRDAAWAGLVARVESGVCVAVDYGPPPPQRPPAGSLAAHRAGRLVPVQPDGSCDLTADVALDSLDGARAGATLRTQREALSELGVAATRPAAQTGDPATYLAALQHAGAAAELLDPGGLGGFGWLQRRVVIGQPEPAPARVGR